MKLHDVTLFEDNTGSGLKAWAESLLPHQNASEQSRVYDATQLLLKWHHEKKLDLALARQGAFMAQTLADLKLDADTIIAALCFGMAHVAKFNQEELGEVLTPDIAKLIMGVTQMDAVESLRAKQHDAQQYEHQMDNLRLMLLAMVEDVRVVLIKLAELLYLLQDAKNFDEARQRHLAVQARELYAPLANRLGLGHIKWQLEDWAFRYLDPQQYKNIAKHIAEKRPDRQKAIADVIEQLESALKEDGIEGEVNGRVKHIYSIWRKMQRKNIEYEEVYDVRAVRILVNKISECYGALGTVHRLWQHIPKEFDDYIAHPKPNGYRSLHTAVMGPSGKALEVQIRTHEMHEESELGVCAHWAYKEDSRHSSAIQDKVKWLRSLLEWQEEVTEADEVLSELQKNVSEERVYVFTPKGEVIDLPKGATPLDFAYHVHTQVGHRTRGAKINGRIVPLTYQLNTGEQIEILTQKDPKPGRDWINPDSGYIYTARARSKARSWFKQQNRDENIREGRLLLDKELERLDIKQLDYDEVARRYNYHETDEVFAALGRGDLRVVQIINAGTHSQRTQQEDAPVVPQIKTGHTPKSEDITIEGVGNLLTTIARCCNPVPGDNIRGFVTHGRGVTIHRQNCPNLLYAEDDSPGRVLEVNWGSGDLDGHYPVDIRVKFYDRKNLLRDLTAVLAHQRVNLIAIDSKMNRQENVVTFNITIEVPDLTYLGRVLEQINNLPNIISAQRVVQEGGS